MSDNRIAKMYGVSNFTVRYWRRQFSLPPSPVKNPGHTIYRTDQDFFAQIDTPEKAYVLGFIVADGSIHKNGKTVDIALKTSDADILRAIARLLNCDAPLRRKVGTNGFGGKTRETLRLNLCGRKLVNDLNALGVHHDKTRTATYPSVPIHLERHLIRGLFDGDGYIGRQQFRLVGTDAVVEGTVAAVARHTACQVLMTRSNGFLYATGMRRHRDALRWMYADASISLERKAEAFRLYWS